MKIRFILILSLLFIGSLPLVTPIIAESNEVPTPLFVSITPDGNPSGSLIFDVNETITIRYTADRSSVDGLILLGTGSNLTTSINNENAVNLTKVSSLKDKSTYEAIINVTSYTIFYAYAWSVTITNGTTEEFDLFDGIEGHQLWVNSQVIYPEFDTIENATVSSSGFYTSLNSVVTIVYTIKDPNNDTTITLSFGNNDTEVFDDDVTDQFAMLRLDHDVETNYTTFKYNYTHSQRIVLFSAFSENGWERQALDASKEVIHVITNGFSFAKSFTEDLDKYTDIDNIELNVTSYNETNEDNFFIRYRSFDNESAVDNEVEWEIIALIANISFSLQNDSNNYNTTVHDYNAFLPKFNVSQIVEVQVYVEYKTGTYNESTPIKIEIKDSRPTINISSLNNTITRYENATVAFSFSNVRGDVLNATLLSNYTSSLDIKGKDNSTVDFTNSTNNEIINGLHIVEILVFNTLNQSRMISIFFSVDTIKPIAEFLASSDTITGDDGRATISFDFNDAESTSTGIKFAELDWGDGIAINVTSLKSATHYYRINSTEGSYTLILTVYDNAGNMIAINTTIITNIKTTESTIEPTPVDFVIMIFGIGIMVFYKKRRN